MERLTQRLQLSLRGTTVGPQIIAGQVDVVQPNGDSRSSDRIAVFSDVERLASDIPGSVMLPQSVSVSNSRPAAARLR